MCATASPVAMIRLLARSSTVLGLVLTLSGCTGGGAAAVKYYVIDPVDSALMAESAAQPLAIEIIDLQVPQYLERARIATRDGTRLSPVILPA